MSTLKVDDIQSRQSTDDAISLASDSSVSIKHSASARLTTTSTGVSITGTCTATSFSGDGSSLTGVNNFGPSVLQESFHDDTSAISSTHNHDILTNGMVWNGSANASAAFTFNIRGNSSTTFDSLISTGKVTTMTLFSANNNASYYMSAFQIDGSTQTIKWSGGAAPSAATGSGVDVYTITIFKTGSATYSVFGNFTNFA